MGSANAVPEHKAADYFEMERDIAVANNMYVNFHFQQFSDFFLISRQILFLTYHRASQYCDSSNCFLYFNVKSPLRDPNSPKEEPGFWRWRLQIEISKVFLYLIPFGLFLYFYRVISSLFDYFVIFLTKKKQIRAGEKVDQGKVIGYLQFYKFYNVIQRYINGTTKNLKRSSDLTDSVKQTFQEIVCYYLIFFFLIFLG